jgi:hypothetical protein
MLNIIVPVNFCSTSIRNTTKCDETFIFQKQNYVIYNVRNVRSAYSRRGVGVAEEIRSYY